jgi:hypothetical protein
VKAQIILWEIAIRILAADYNKFTMVNNNIRRKHGDVSPASLPLEREAKDTSP